MLLYLIGYCCCAHCGILQNTGERRIWERRKKIEHVSVIFVNCAARYQKRQREKCNVHDFLISFLFLHLRWEMSLWNCACYRLSLLSSSSSSFTLFSLSLARSCCLFIDLHHVRSRDFDRTAKKNAFVPRSSFRESKSTAEIFCENLNERQYTNLKMRVSISNRLTAHRHTHSIASK